MKVSIVLKTLLVAAIALTTCNLLLPKTKIVMVRDSGDRADVQSDLAVIKSRMVRCGASEIAMRLRGDSLVISFHSPKKAPDWKSVLTLEGRFRTANLVRNRDLPRVREAILRRFGRGVDLRPDLHGMDTLVASMALIDRDRHAEVDSFLAGPEILMASDGKAQPLWGSEPGSFNVNEIRHVGDDLYLASTTPPSQAQLGNAVIESAKWFAESGKQRELVELELKPEGSEIFRKLMEENRGRFLAIVVDDRVLEAPMILEPVEADRFVITGCGTMCQALADVLPGDPLKCGWKLVDLSGR